MLIFLASTGWGAVNRYVDLNCATPVSPYLSWATAATTISGAVAVAEAGDTVWVTNGLYEVTAQIVVSNAIAVRSVNGPATVTVGRTDPAVTNRIFFINSPGAVLDGLTIFNGLLYSGGGCGVYLNQGLLTNCVVVSNHFSRTIAAAPWSYGAGIYVNTGELRNCTIANNGAYTANYSEGGGVYVKGTATIDNCTIGPMNKAQYGAGMAGNNISMSGSRIWGNESHNRAAGMYLSSGCQVVSCLIESNTMAGVNYGSQAGIQNIWGGCSLCCRGVAQRGFGGYGELHDCGEPCNGYGWHLDSHWRALYR